MKNIYWLKKPFSMLCATALVLTASLGIAPSVVSAEETTTGTGSNRYDPWDGSTDLDVTAVEYAGGDGTEDNPYLIENGDQLYKAAVEGESKYFRLENDIYLNDVSDESWYSGTDLNEWITDGNTFCGHFDGNGNVVHGIYYKDTAAEMAALFPKLGPYDSVTSVTVKNVGIEDSYIQGTYAGAITAVVDGNRDGNHTVNISCCYADESVYLNGSNSNGFVAFLFNYYFTMDNCASRVRMIGTPNTGEPRGSLLGAMYLPDDENGLSAADKAKKITIKDCYAVLQKEDRNNGFSAVPQSWAGRFVRYENVHAGVNPDGNGNSIAEGADFVLNNQTNCIFTHWPSDFRKSEKTNPLTGFSNDVWYMGYGGEYWMPKVFVKSDVWNGSSNLNVSYVNYAGGDGTEANPYLIVNGNQLYKAAVEGESKYFRLENDIYLNDVSDESWYSGIDLNEWITDGKTFCGHFDGNGYVVHGIYYKDTTSEFAGLFPKLSAYDDARSVTVKNVGVEDSYIQGKYAGAITAVVDGNRDGNHNVEISCCYADESVYLNGTEANGFVAFLFNYYFTMDNCASRVRMIGTPSTSEPRGSLLGAMYLLPEENGATNVDNAKKITIKNCYAVIQKEDRDNGFTAVPQSWTGRHIRYENVHAGVYPNDSGYSIVESLTLNNQSDCVFKHWPSDFRASSLISSFSREIWLAGDGADRYMIPKVFVTFEYGDTNRDLSVDIRDLVYLKKVTLNVEGVSNNNSDLNGDGNYDAADLILLRTKLLNG